MKKILALLLCMAFLLSGCGNTIKQELSSTEGKILTAEEAKGMYGVEGKISNLSDDSISIRVKGEIYIFETSKKFNNQVKEYAENGEKIKAGTYIQLFCKEVKTEESKIYKDVYSSKLVADSFAIVYQN